MPAAREPTPSRTPLPDDVAAALRRLGLIEEGASIEATPLAGGVSSDIWRVDRPAGALCVKRALARLRVSADWRAPVERNAYEAAWMRCAAEVVPRAVPAILGEDESSRLFAMTYLEPKDYPPWKSLLRDGVAEATTARAVGDCLGRIHAATADRSRVAQHFATDELFHAIRLEPYLLATARAHPDRADALRALARATAQTRRALVHGDVSPKNILVGREGPVFLDAECAWYGDPAFDLAFCLNHLLLKCLWTPQASAGFLRCYAAVVAGYSGHVRWERWAELEARAARLLPGLMLARVDGKSPVEYLDAEADRDRVRAVARGLLARPVSRLAEVASAWRDELDR